MAAAGESEIIDNPSTGERVAFRRRTPELLEFELMLRPGARATGVPHRHAPSELISVRSGTLGAYVAGAGRRLLQAGGELEVPAWRTHHLWNAGEGDVTALVQLRPAGDVEGALRVLSALARRGQARVRGLPSPLRAAIVARAGGLFAPLVPVALQRPLLAVLDSLGRRRGCATILATASPPEPVPPPGGPGALDIARTEVIIDAPVEAVFAALAEPACYPRWVVGSAATRAVEGRWPEPASTFHHTQGVRRIGLRDTSSVISAIPPEELELVVRVRPLLVNRVRLALRPLGGCTHVTMFEQPLTGAVAGRWPRALSVALEPRNVVSLIRLRRLVERSAASRE